MTTTTTRTADRWLAAYAAAWREQRPERAHELFTDDATYASDPFGPALVGANAVADYWRAVLPPQQDIDLTVRDPIVDGDRAATEWWVSFRRDGTEQTLAAALILVFAPDGRCHALREYWRATDGRRPAPTPGTVA